jgi:[acyl-carrier-protein] S-malonyltransferase
MKIAFLFPGQGSQFVGMGRELYDQVPEVRTLFARASKTLEIDMGKLCFEGPESTLLRTDNVQPAVTLVNIACFHVLEQRGIVPAAAAGHSLGEYSALYSAGVFSFDDAMRVVRSRGAYMQEAAQRNAGGMMAVMGLGIERFDAICERARAAGAVDVANHNSRTQVILTGQQAALELAAEVAKKEGAAYAVPLKVSGPWHSRFMAPAIGKMEALLRNCALSAPRIPVASNVTGDYFAQVDDIRRGLVRQVVSPVRWLACVERLARDGCELFVELGPGTMLAGLMRDIDNKLKVISVGNLESLGKLEALVSSP